MKKILSVLLIILVSATIGFAQKTDKAKAVYSFNGKTGEEVTMTWDEFSKSKKELTPIDKSVKIESFSISLLHIGKGMSKEDGATGSSVQAKNDSIFIQEDNVGNKFSDASLKVIESVRADKRPVTKILVEKVMVTQNGKQTKVPGMIIKLK